MKIIYAAVYPALILLLCLVISTDGDKSSSASKVKKNEEAKIVTLPPCASCRVLVESFKKVSVN